MAKHARIDNDETFEKSSSGSPDASEPSAQDQNAPIEISGVSGQEDAPQQKSEQQAHTKAKRPLSPRQLKSRRMRIILIVVAALLILLIGVLIFLTWALLQESSNLASQQTQQLVSQELESIQDDNSDSSTEVTSTTEAIDLVSLMGMTQDEAIAAIDRGATISATREVDEEGNPIKTSLTISLTEEPADSQLGTPTVYLGLDADGYVIMAGYSAATSLLGYGSLSFLDAVETEGIIEQTLADCGIEIDSTSILLPDDTSEYSTYASDGTTLVEEEYSFTGTVTINDTSYVWSSVLIYDYRLANASSNLADTIRQIYVYFETEAAADAENVTTE